MGHSGFLLRFYKCTMFRGIPCKGSQKQTLGFRVLGLGFRGLGV